MASLNKLRKQVVEPIDDPSINSALSEFKDKDEPELNQRIYYISDGRRQLGFVVSYPSSAESDQLDHDNAQLSENTAQEETRVLLQRIGRIGEVAVCGTVIAASIAAVLAGNGAF